MEGTYRSRAIEPLLRRLLQQLPALLVVGPRAAGKTTTALRLARTIVRLDHPAEATAFTADPDAALRGFNEPILLDEWQAVPGVLAAVKRSVDADPRPGRFILTGSVRADLETETWPGTGRLVRIPMYGMTIGEQDGRPLAGRLLERLERGESLEPAIDSPDLRGYVELALRSGFPQAALSLSDDVRARWLESYVDQILTRDAARIASGRDPVRIRRFLEAFAMNSAGVVQDATLVEATGITRPTAAAYEQLLSDLLVVESTPAWSSNRLKRLVRQGKRYVVDPALIAATLRLDVNGVMRDGEVLGRLLDSFVMAQLRTEVTISSSRPRLFHLRQREGRHEIDILAELGGGRIIAIEVKASSAPDGRMARHLVWLRDQLGDRFVAGVLLHTGQRTFNLGAKIVAAPISTLWS